MKLNLYQLADNYAQLLDLADSAVDDGDLAAIRDTLESLIDPIEEKIERCARVVRSIDLDAGIIREEEKRLASRRRAMEASIGRIKLYMHESMEKCGLTKCKGELFTVSIQNNPPTVVLDVEPAKLPADYQRITIEANKTAIGEDLKAGKKLDCAHLEVTKGLRIR